MVQLILHSGGTLGAPAHPHKYIVARESEGFYWYWGSWEDVTRASEVAKIENGVVFDRDTSVLMPYYECEQYNAQH